MIISSPLFLAFLTYASLMWAPCSPIYMNNVHLRQQGKLEWMQRELVIDAMMKVKAVQQFRDDYYKSLQFQLGDLVYELRDFYKKMVRFYQGVDRNISYGYLDHNENCKMLIRIHRMSLEIENKVIMVQHWHAKRETKAQHHERMQAVLRTGVNREYDELEEVPLREVQVRERLARGAAAAGAPWLRAHGRPAALHLGGQRENKKWRHIRDDDFS